MRTFVTKMSSTCNAEEKTNKKNDVKARSLLLMALPNEHQLTFSQYSDAKTMFAAIKTRFGGNEPLQKTQKDTVEATYEQFYIANFSDNTVYAFMVQNPNGSNLLQQDLEEIHEDDLETMDLKWQLSLLSMRAKRYFQRSRKKIFINANDTDGYDKSKVECFNYHKMGHFSRECRAPRNKEGQFKYQDNTRKQGNNEDTSSKAMLAIDGVGFDWSDMAEEQCDDLIVKLNQTEFTAATYKRGLAIVEEQLITYRKNEVLFCEEVAVLKREVACKDYEINVHKNASKEDFDDSLVKEKVSEDTSSFVESSLNVDKETVFLVDKKIEFVKPKNHEKPVKKSVRLIVNTIKGKGWNMVPRAVLMKAGLKPCNTARTVNTARTKAVNTARPHLAVVNVVRVNQANVVKTSACWVWRPTKPDSASITLKKHNYIDARGRSNGCSRHMTGNIAYLSDFKEFNGGYVTFGGGAHGGRISGKGTLKTDSLDFEDVYFVNELNFNLFSVSQMCDKKNYVLFTDTECLVLSPNFKLPDESQILLKIPRKDNMYSFDMKNIVPKESLTCLVAKATSDESMLWHRRLGHINFKNINKLVKDNLVRGLPTKRFENDQTCVACLKGKQHRASCKSKVPNLITKPLFMLHIDLFGLTFVEDGPHNESDEKDKSNDDSSPREVNAAGQHVNTVSPEVNTGHFKLNTIDPSVNTASSNELDSPKDMFKMGASHTLETTHVEFFNDEDEPEINLGNITDSSIIHIYSI
ncbi:putative ribonuclease H-like domain-containing protein [Tanacetum coccineum]